MSSGACRALVAVLLTLVATIVMVLPVAAQNQDQLIDSTSVTYTVDPAEGTVTVVINGVLKATRNWPGGEWGPLVVDQRPSLKARAPYTIADRTSNLPGLWEAIDLETPRISAQEQGKFQVRYTMQAATDLDRRRLDRTAARLDDSYVYFCVTGQDTQQGSVVVKFEGNASAWQPVLHGTPMEPTANGFRSRAVDRPNAGDIFTCFEAVRSGRLQPRTIIGPADREILLQSWSGLDAWLEAAATITPGVLRDIRAFLDYDIPGEGPVVVRTSPSSDIGGYASAHRTRGVVQLDEGLTDPQHDLAHAWFSADTFLDDWLREGLAEWTDTAMNGEACEPVTSNPLDLEMNDEGWQVVQPQSPDDWEERIAAQEAAACGIVTAVQERMSADRWHEVLGSMLLGETKYIGSAGPEIGTSALVDWREWLDAVDERGLVPAAADPEYAANLDDLDWAQNVLADFGIPEVVPELGTDQLDERSQARVMYHGLLDHIAPLGAPNAVRKDMDDWDFQTAMSRIELSREVYDQLARANELLPQADLIRIVQPQYEAARNEDELAEVAALVEALLEGAEFVVEPLERLNNALPAGWTPPAVVNVAIGQLRWDDVVSAIEPALVTASAITAADAALPQAGFLEKYRDRYQNTITESALRDLAGEAEDDRRRAELAGGALESLEDEVAAIGGWTIPVAVTATLEQGELQRSWRTIEDARAVVRATAEADEALPAAGLGEEIQPRFEAVQTPAEMAALREEVEERASEAKNVGDALQTLDRLVPTWTVPAVVADPVAAGDFSGAIDSAVAAQRWVEAAHQAEQDLPEIEAMSKTQPAFEGAQSLEDLEAGAALAQKWRDAASRVRLAIERAGEPRDMLTNFGLWGVSIEPNIEAAIEAAKAGEVQTAIEISNQVITDLDGGAGAGSLRLAGIVFFGVAVLGVLGLWVMLRRQRGPSWARSTTPHWIEGENKKTRGLLGRGKSDDDKGKK